MERDPLTQIETDSISADVRRARRERILGTDAACILCGSTTPEALMRVNRSLLEKHHIVGRAHDAALTVPVCRNCHAILTEGQRTLGCDFRAQQTLPERMVNMFRALASFFMALANTFASWAVSLTALIGALDAHHPAWREMPEAAQ